MKDTEKGPIVSNFRPITCLPLMWKLLTSVLADAMYEHLTEKDCSWMNKKAVEGNQEAQKISY